MHYLFLHPLNLHRQNQQTHLKGYKYYLHHQEDIPHYHLQFIFFLNLDVLSLLGYQYQLRHPLPPQRLLQAFPSHNLVLPKQISHFHRFLHLHHFD